MTQPLIGSALSLLTLLGTSAALAGPTQASISLPGGFATACASQISTTTVAPGWDMTGHFANFPGQNACQSQEFSGAAGQAGATASWTAPDLANRAVIQARMGSIGLVAQNDAPGGFTYFFPVGVANGGWADKLRVDLAGHEGQAAVWRFTMDVGGSMLNAGWGATTLEMTAFKNRVELLNNVPGYDKGNSDPRSTELQRVGYRASYGADRAVQDVVTFAVPVTIGQSFDWGVFAMLQAGATSSGPSPERSTALADFGQGLGYGGSAGLWMDGVEVQGWTMDSASGIDWLATPVPEPGTWALMLAGVAALLARRRWN